ncbi:MAG: elongation factor P maturation arginine rhamnosyltransferase EarP [Betaproteobacteria bacterium]
MRNRWDIFCRVVDNHGDIGVCWRLSRQLVAEHGLAVRLWLDDLASLVPLQPGVAPTLPQQSVAGVEVCHWSADFPQVAAADVVIEAFACELPQTYLAAMQRSGTPLQWINLEYLSAESWIEGYHTLSSPHPTRALNKHFFFPGFTARTGGLLRESNLLGERDAFCAALPARRQLEISLFCYDTAPVGPLLDAWAAGTQDIRCRVPPGKPLAAVARHLGGTGPWRRGRLLVEPIPFLPQSEYDRLLWSCDVNFVRGEDSFVRAQWAAHPFVWQIYPQADNAHLAKLEAFLDRYLEGLPAEAATAARNLFLAWNGSGDIASAWAAFDLMRPALSTHGEAWANGLAANGDLTTNLVKFCTHQI